MLVILYRRNEQGQAWYYTLDDRQQSLFAPFCLTVSWGRHPEGGRKTVHTFESAEAKNKMIRQLLKRKLKDYKVLYSYFKEMQESLKAPPADSAEGPFRDWAARHG